MSEATIKILSTALANEEPFIGDGEGGEPVANLADGRLWVFDPVGTPVELGGACVNVPIGTNLFASNYLSLDVTDPNNLPVPVPDPLLTPQGIYRNLRVLMRFTQSPLQDITTYFDYDVDWGDVQGDPLAAYSTSGSMVLVELSVFGPMPYWMAKVIWGKTA